MVMTLIKMQKDYYSISKENKISEVDWLIIDVLTARPSVEKKSRQIVKALGYTVGHPDLELGSNDLEQSS